MNTGVGCHALLQGNFPTQELNSSLWCLLHWQADSLPMSLLQVDLCPLEDMLKLSSLVAPKVIEFGDGAIVDVISSSEGSLGPNRVQLVSSYEEDGDTHTHTHTHTVVMFMDYVIRINSSLGRTLNSHQAVTAKRPPESLY